MYKHIIILEHGDSVMSSSMFFLVELYSLKHQARLTIEMPIENNWAVSMLFSWKSTLDQKNKSTQDYSFFKKRINAHVHWPVFSTT